MKKIRIFVGTGGVGKTSLTAAAALRAAQGGEKSLVLTIDPALRLRTALNLGPGELEHRVALEDDVHARGELWAALLDVGATLDRAVELYAEPGQAKTVLEHPVYKVLIQSLAGMQELMAIERIDQAFREGFDNLYIDTAPSRHAFEFLDKPEFFAELVGLPAIRFVGRTYKWFEDAAVSRLGRKSMELYSRVEQLLGSTLLRQVLDFYSVFRTIAEGYADRARKTSKVLRDPAITGFTIVTTPSKAAGDADYFWSELSKRRYPVSGLIVNRVWPIERSGAGIPLPEPLAKAVAWYDEVSRAHRQSWERIKSEYSSRIPRVVGLPELSRDVDGLPALRCIAENLGSAEAESQAK